jgi:hypothetical protein
VVDVLGELVEGEVLGDAGHAPGLGLRLECADEELARVLLVVGAFVGHAQHRQVRRQAGDLLCHDVEVLAGVERNGGARHQADLTRPHPGAVDDVLAFDRAEWRLDRRGAAALDVDAGDLDALDDADAVLAGAPGQRLGDVRGIGLTVGRDEDATDDARGVEERVFRRGVLGGEDNNLEAEGAGHRRAALQLLEALVGQCDAERAVLLQSGGDAGLGFEPGVELLGVLGEARQVLGGPELSDQAGGMPGGAAGELLALEQHDVAPAEPGARW